MTDNERPSHDEAMAAARVLFPGNPALQAIMAQVYKPAGTRMREGLEVMKAIEGYRPGGG